MGLRGMKTIVLWDRLGARLRCEILFEFKFQLIFLRLKVLIEIYYLLFKQYY